jgi:hypothetical protein
MSRTGDNDAAGGYASPACAMHRADEAYMGFLGREELVRLLDGLVGATRGLAEAPPGAVSDALRRDAARWCAVLIRDMARLNATSSPARHGAVPAATLRDQLCVTLRAMLPKVRDDRLHGELAGILRAHSVHP